MRRLALFAVIVMMTTSVPAAATAVYDYSVVYGLSFSSPWATAATVYRDTHPWPVGSAETSQESYGTGLYSATAWPFESLAGPDNRSWRQSVRVTGTAGNAVFDESGTSRAKSWLTTLFTFDFGAVPVDLVVTLTEHSFVLTSSEDLPWNERNETGEWVGGSGGTQFIFDYGAVRQLMTPGEQATFLGLTGQHTIRIYTIAEATARANYPYVAPDPGSTLLLLGMGLAGLGAWRRRWQ